MTFWNAPLFLLSKFLSAEREREREVTMGVDVEGEFCRRWRVKAGENNGGCRSSMEPSLERTLLLLIPRARFITFIKLSLRIAIREMKKFS